MPISWICYHPISSQSDKQNWNWIFFYELFTYTNIIGSVSKRGEDICQSKLLRIFQKIQKEKYISYYSWTYLYTLLKDDIRGHNLGSKWKFCIKFQRACWKVHKRILRVYLNIRLCNILRSSLKLCTNM